MKTITIKQPWAWLIIEGVKDIENRTWPTKFRGRVLIHAAAKPWIWQALLEYLTPAMKLVFYKCGASHAWLDSLTKSKIIGSIEIIDCVINHPGIWAEKCEPIYKFGTEKIVQATYNWDLTNPIKFPEPIPAKGKLSFWEYEGELPEIV